MDTSRTIPTSPAVLAGLIGGYATVRYTRNRDWGGLVLGSAGAWCAWQWLRSSGPGVMGALLGAYVGAFGAAHPLAKKIGAWPAVLAVAVPAAGVTFAVADRQHRPSSNGAPATR